MALSTTHDAPDVLYYQCTSHAAMNGILYITGALADGSVTTAKLANNAVSTVNIAANTVTTAILQDASVTLAKLEHGTSSNDGKFLRANNGADPTFETVSGTTINNNANNKVITGSGTANTLEAEANLTFDGDDLLLKSSTDGRRISFATDGTSHYMKYDNTLSGIVLNGYGGIAFETNGTNERMRIDSSGRLLLGATSSRTIQGESALQVEDDSSSLLSITRTSNNNGACFLTIGKTRNGAVLQNNDVIGILNFHGDDGTDLATPAAQIRVAVDGTPGSNDMPGRLEFMTTADGASASTERMRIDSSGNVLIGTTTFNNGNFTGAGHGITVGGTAPQITLHRTDNDKDAFFGNNGTNAYLFTADSMNLVFGTSDAERLRIQSGGGISFNGDTAAANALDDYEEGTWSPSIGSGSTTNIYSPRYTKIGNLCTISFAAYGFSDNSSGTAFYFTGLPFTSDSQGGAGLSVGACFTAKFSVESNIISYVGASTTTIRFYDHSTGDYDAVRHSNINGTDTTHRIFTTITYTTA